MQTGKCMNRKKELELQYKQKKNKDRFIYNTLQGILKMLQPTSERSKKQKKVILALH